MKKITIILTTFTIMVIAHGAFGQSAGNVIYNSPILIAAQKANVNVNMPSGNQVFLQADVMINIKATSYAAIFSATQNGLTASETDSLMNIRLKTVKDAMKRIGIKQNEIHIDVISFVPSYSLKLEEKKFTRTANEIPTGFQLKKNIHILFYDKIPYNQFDHVMNADFVEPRIQFFYTLKVRYTVTNEELYQERKEQEKEELEKSNKRRSNR